MYVNNPTKEQLNAWFKCAIKTGEYLIYKLGASPIHKDEDFYYFVKSLSFQEKYKKLPLFTRLVNKI